MRVKAQAFSEYVIIISVVLAALLTMRVYLQRSLQGRIKDVTDVFLASDAEHTPEDQGIIPLLQAVNTENTNIRSVVTSDDESIDVDQSEFEVTSGGGKKIRETIVNVRETTEQEHGSDDIKVTKQTAPGAAHTETTRSFYFVTSNSSLLSNSSLADDSVDGDSSIGSGIGNSSP